MTFRSALHVHYQTLHCKNLGTNMTVKMSFPQESVDLTEIRCFFRCQTVLGTNLEELSTGEP